MKLIFNNWFTKLFVTFIFIAFIIFGSIYYFYSKQEKYYYSDYSNGDYHYFIKINKDTGDIYKFSANTSAKEWILIKK